MSRCANTGPSTKWTHFRPDGSAWAGITSPRRALTLDEAQRGDMPKPFNADEWADMAKASRGEK